MNTKNHAGRRERERREARLRIIDAARELFTGGGEEALTLRRVAQCVEYSATTIYLHFRNKEALIRELCAADFAVFGRRLAQAERLANPVERLQRVAGGYVDFGLQFPAQYRAMFVTIGSVAGTDANKEATPQDFLQAAVFKGLAAGIFKHEYRDVPLLTQTLWAGLHGVVSLHQTRAKHPAITWRSIQALTETMIECLLHGMMASGFATVPTWRRSE